jgi:hypothetical protein
MSMTTVLTNDTADAEGHLALRELNGTVVIPMN